MIKEYIIEQDSTSEEENFNVASLSSPSTVSIAASWNNNFNKNVTKYLRIKGRMISQDPTSPAVVTDAATSNLNIYVNNSSPSYGVYAAGGALGGQPGGHAIDVENPGAPAIRKVFVECEGSDSRIYAGGGGGVTGIDGFQVQMVAVPLLELLDLLDLLVVEVATDLLVVADRLDPWISWWWWTAEVSLSVKITPSEQII